MSIQFIQVEPSQIHLIQEAKCSICLSSLIESESDSLEKVVSHVADTTLHSFHKECLEAWLKQKPECPLCRKPLNFLTRSSMKITKLWKQILKLKQRELPQAFFGGVFVGFLMGLKYAASRPLLLR